VEYSFDLIEINQLFGKGNCDKMDSVSGAQFLFHVGHMKIDNPFAAIQNYRNFPRAFPIFQPIKNFSFTGG
jgi:hypothetical protein